MAFTSFPLPTPTGTITVTNGEADFTGTGAGLTRFPAGTVLMPVGGLPVVIADDPTDNDAATAQQAYGGTTLEDVAYSVVPRSAGALIAASQQELTRNLRAKEGNFGWRFSTATDDSAPASGYLHFNHEDAESADLAYINDVDMAGNDLGDYLDTLEGGTAVMQSMDRPGVFFVVTLGTVSDLTGHRSIALSAPIGAPDYQSDERLAFFGMPAGPAGANGADGVFSGTQTVFTDATNAIGAALNGRTLIANRGSAISFDFVAAATLGETFSVIIKNENNGTLTLNPDGSETIDGENDLTLEQGESLVVHSDGTNLRTGLAGGPNLVRNSQATLPVNTGQVWFSQNGNNPTDEPIFGRSTPETASLSLHEHYDENGGAGVGYKWGWNAWVTNPATAPVTVYDSIAQGWKVRGAGFTARQIGDDGDGHALELLSGQWAATANVDTVDTSADLTVNSSLRGARFCVGNAISGDGIPGGTTILSVTKGGNIYTASSVDTASPKVGNEGSGYVVGDVLTANAGGTKTVTPTFEVMAVDGSGAITKIKVLEQGNYTSFPSGAISVTGGSGAGVLLDLSEITAGVGYPDTITMDADATATASGITATALSADTLGIAALITGSGDGGSDGTGNPNGRGIQFQSYGDAAFKAGIFFGPTAIRSNGDGIVFSGVAAETGITVESDCVFSRAAIGVKAGGITSGKDTRDSSGASALVGITMNDSGLIASTADAALSLSCNRKTSDGDTVRFRRDGGVVGSISVGASTTAYNTTSDKRLKDDMGELSFAEARAVLDLVTFHRFRWNEHSAAAGVEDDGVFAQELFKVYPKAVSVGGWRKIDPANNCEVLAEQGDEGAEYVPWSVDYSKLVTIIGRCLQGIMERQDEIERKLSRIE